MLSHETDEETGIEAGENPWPEAGRAARARIDKQRGMSMVFIVGLVGSIFG